MALPKANRLKHRHDFSAVYRRGIRRTTKHLTLRALHQPKANRPGFVSQANLSEELSATRIGISISRKVSKHAVTRNRIKRQIWAGLQTFLPRLLPGWQLIVVVHPQATQCDYHQFLQELRQLLVDAEVLNGHS